MYLFLFTVVFVLSSCGSPKNIVYFQGIDHVPGNVFENDASRHEVVIAPNDNLLIFVSAIRSEIVEIFNMVRTDRMTNNISEYHGYLVDSEGFINFPLVGKVKLGGLSKEQAVKTLEEKISDFVENPTVNLRLMNYKISVLGEVARPGVYSVVNEKVTIPEALAMAGDITITGLRQQVLLHREVNGKKEFYRIDMTKPDLFFSPYFYLQQNDVLYVQPNKARIGTSTSFYRDAPLFISAVSLIITIIALTIK
jgi:polysaccharide export outer membrane protein